MRAYAYDAYLLHACNMQRVRCTYTSCTLAFVCLRKPGICVQDGADNAWQVQVRNLHFLQARDLPPRILLPLQPGRSQRAVP